MTRRTSMPRRRSARGRAPATSPRPPVLANGAHSETTNNALSGGAAIRRDEGNGVPASGRVHAVVDVREDVVAGLDRLEPLFAHRAGVQVVVQPREVPDVLVEPA